MDPASATNLAAAILQLAIFSAKVLSRSQELYKAADGALIHHNELSIVAKNFNAFLKSLKAKQTSADSNLHVLATQAQDATQDLLDLLDRLKATPDSNRRWKSVRQALLTLMKESQLQELEQRIEHYRCQIDSALMRDLSAHVLEIQNEQREHAQEVRGYYSIIKENSEIHERLLTALDVSAKRTTPSGESIPRHFATHLLTSLSENDCKKQEKRLAMEIVESLWFRDMPTRHKTIPKAYESTFDWMFKTPNQVDSKDEWADFTAWLQSSDNMYWIAGKPGAGKSTLMKYLFDHDKTDKLANRWPKALPADANTPLLPLSRPRPHAVTKAGFFFWNSGSGLQMSIEGFARSLITQICDHTVNGGHTHDVISVARLFPIRWKRSEILGLNDDPFTWGELKQALNHLLSTPGRFFMLFIDGLDEFEGNKDELADLVLSLSAKPNVKICAASRPWVEFQSKFHSMPQLLMEKLTRKDIATYVDGNFAKSREFQALKKFEPHGATVLTEGIKEKASGIFLWVYVVVSTLLHGLRDGDRLKDLVDKLNGLPPELDELFDKILRQLDPRHEKEASELFQFVHANPVDSNLISLYWSQLTLKEVLESETRAILEDEKSYYAEVMRRNLLSRCKCLLNPEDGTHPISRVTWVHRTAREYLRRADVWERIRSQSSRYDPSVALALSLLRQAKASITAYENGDHCIEPTLCEALSAIKTLDLLGDRIAFLDQIDAVGRKACTNAVFSHHWLHNVRLLDISHMFQGSTSIFHVAVGSDWQWYVAHRLATDPVLLHLPVSTAQTYDALMLAAMHDLWDMQYLCLQNGADPNKIYNVSSSLETDNTTAWQRMLERTSHKLRLDSSQMPWDKVVRNTATFLQHGADPYIRLQSARLGMDNQAEAVVAGVIKAAKEVASEHHVKVIRKVYSRKRDSFFAWRR